jgi:ribosomal protein L37AE/L43A
MSKMKPICRDCGETYAPARKAAGFRVCLECGEAQAKAARKHWCVAPMHKSNYMLFTQKADLVGINNKGGLVK